jgi:glutathione S-transferase
VLEWMMWEQDVLFTGVGRTRFLTKVVKGDPGAIAFLRKLGERGLGVLETRLGESPYLAGAAPTVADIAVYSYARLAEEAGYDLGGQPKILAWRKSIEALPGWAPPATLMPIA